ncbi:Zn-dependent hydrolase [Paenibacillus sp. JX-17]|uniref:Zn-dependent hydrolase n=1 Tax=Paenibacillus lacisoli TaxID=3064525 RepID=A0ABT9C8K7_9BACL|nr:Zn-dependent hydrolase [Paenibacillus sp. JX-17]MDO7905584.1 Zn-dependent hydrolase [Paenibacillus sp. JX-17]
MYKERHAKVEHTNSLFHQYAQRLNDQINHLARHGADAAGGVTRLLYSDTWVQAQGYVREIMEESGLETRYDWAGNLTGSLHGSRPELPPVISGSHIDSVTHGGKYDGALGVLAAVYALAYLKASYGTPVRGLSAISLSEEEGSRFPFAYWGSGSITGARRLDELQDMRDREGITLLQAMEHAGFGPGSGYEDPRAAVVPGAFLELHIEQGCELERTSSQIGVVTAIVGQKRWEVLLSGKASHAGTTPMLWRKDALAGAAEMILSAEALAACEVEGLVATVGHLQIEPSTSNVVPGAVNFTVDLRHADAAVLQQCGQRLASAFKDIAAERGLELVCMERMHTDPVLMEPGMMKQAAYFSEQLGLSYMKLSSGAGHDSQMFRELCPTAMIFVPSRDGISHNPLEYTSTEQVTDGFRLLVSMLYYYGYGGGAHEEL